MNAIFWLVINIGLSALVGKLHLRKLVRNAGRCAFDGDEQSTAFLTAPDTAAADSWGISGRSRELVTNGGLARYPVTASFPDPVSPRAGRARERPTRRLASRTESSPVALLIAIAPPD